MDGCLRPRVIAVTGGIASGKSAVCEAFSALGRQVDDADQVARELVAPGESALAQIVQRFGPEMLDASGALDRGRLRAQVFASPEDRLALEGILHPRIRDTLRRRAAQAPGPYSLVAVPLLLESGGWDWVDRVLLVDVPESVQLDRVIRRDRVDMEQAQAVLAAQAPRRARWAIADDVIINDGPLAALAPVVAALDQRWTNPAGDC